MSRRRGTRRSRSEKKSDAPSLIEPRCPATGKRQYATEDDALRAGWEFAQNNRFVVTSTSAYACPACGLYHLTGGKR